MPVAKLTHGYTIDDTAAYFKTHYVHTDHLQMPRLMTDENVQIIWQRETDAFGFISDNNDPDGDGVDEYMVLGFPGQLHTVGGLVYNYYRDYSPVIGRYL